MLVYRKIELILVWLQANDTRQKLVHRTDLADARSGDAVWDALQSSLVRTGELHNNARMGWGKAIVSWCASPEEALATLFELNNRFALDGHAPPSVGGLLGCLGLFESPRTEIPVYGAVQNRGLKRKYIALATVKTF